PLLHALSLHAALPISTTSDRGSGPTAERLRHARDRSLVHLLHALVGLVGLHRRLRQLIGALVRHPTNLVGLLCTGSTVKVGSHRDRKSTRLNSSHVSI